MLCRTRADQTAATLDLGKLGNDTPVAPFRYKARAALNAKGACLVEGHALHLAGKNAYASCDGEPATAQSLRAGELIKNTGRICILSDRD
jgi:hypothetical protein